MPVERKQRGVRNLSRVNALIVQNMRLARRNWIVRAEQVNVLQTLTRELQLSVALGDLKLLDNQWYVTHSGLLRIAQRNHCVGIETRLIREFSDPTQGRWVFRATVRRARTGQAFGGYGDADPSNVSPLVRGAEMRVAETRAVNRALRKAYGIGLCSVEELGWMSGSSKSSAPPSQPNGSHSSNGSGDGQPRLRDRLCLLIRQYNLDATLVKAYAADFCGTTELRNAGRDLVESFISRLAAAAKQDRDAVVCKLNSYARPAEVKP